MKQFHIGIHGACGRMGQKLALAVHHEPTLKLSAALESPSHPLAGKDIGEIIGVGPIGVPVSPDFPQHLEGVIDFSVPAPAVVNAQRCAERAIPLLVATTGFSADQKQEIVACHHTTALLIAANCSLVVNVLMKLTRQAAVVLRDKDFDVEVMERHHRFKHDAPSGTALQLVEILEQSMGLTERVYGRQGITGERPRTEIGVHALRTGDNVGEHTVIFSTLGETLELVHRGHSRDSYVKGAVEGIKYLVKQKPGLYTMADVLGL